MSISGAEFRMKYKDRDTCYINNEFGNSAQMGFRVFDESGTLKKAGYFNASQIEFGGAGVEDRMYIGVDVETKKAYMSLPNDPSSIMYISFKDNGDGTFNLIGEM